MAHIDLLSNDITSNPTTGYYRVYFKTDGKPYYRDSSGTEIPFGLDVAIPDSSLDGAILARNIDGSFVLGDGTSVQPFYFDGSGNPVVSSGILKLINNPINLQGTGSTVFFSSLGNLGDWGGIYHSSSEVRINSSSAINLNAPNGITLETSTTVDSVLDATASGDVRVRTPTRTDNATPKDYVDGLFADTAKTNISNTFLANQITTGSWTVRSNGTEGLKIETSTGSSVSGFIRDGANMSLYTASGGIVVDTNSFDFLTNNVTVTAKTPTTANEVTNKSYVDGLVSGIGGGLDYQGTWNAASNTPTLASGVGTAGHYYIVGTAGSTNLDGITDWNVGDWVIWSEGAGAWQQVDNTSFESVTNVGSGAGIFKQVVSGTDVQLKSLTNDSYITLTENASDIQIGTQNLVTIDSPQTITGVKTFTSEVYGTSPTNVNAFTTKSYVDTELGNYVTLDTTQTITGLKTLSNGVNLESSATNDIVIDTSNGGNVNFFGIGSTTATKLLGADASYNLTDDSELLLSKFVKTDTTQTITGLKSIQNALRLLTTSHTPTNGDIWYDGTKINFREGAITKTLQTGLGFAGRSVPVATDLDNVANNEFFRVGSSWTGSPFAGTDGRNQGYVCHLEFSSTFAVEVFYPITSGVGIHFRQQISAVWGSWYEQADLDTAQTFTGAKTFSDILQVKTTGNSELYIGDDITDATNDKTGVRVLARETQGDIYLDFKTKTGEDIFFRCGEGAELGSTHTWLKVDPTDGSINFPTITNSSPTNGDIWFDGTNLKGREGGATFNLNGGGGSVSQTMRFARDFAGSTQNGNEHLYPNEDWNASQPTFEPVQAPDGSTITESAIVFGKINTSSQTTVTFNVYKITEGTQLSSAPSDSSIPSGAISIGSIDVVVPSTASVDKYCVSIEPDISGITGTVNNGDQLLVTFAGFTNVGCNHFELRLGVS